ncbi:hypothetical protein K2173_005524 [Erythroxylum novogranatense]|uniref:Protein ROOT INITIATION DEFECTIVE 3-like n=1 Tax=Erythroxylum novogranatense TaxID=1862640 RepID=A0AAV8SK87_9ROSI|nr:hypothetical protein K2173_005524 [Erythroxylum novogranatense]
MEEMKMGVVGQVLAVCMGIGITVWDMETGDRVMHIPTCASPPHGLLCLNDRFLVASQVSRYRSVGGGSVFTWSLNKSQSPLRSYPIEAIGPLASTKDGVYLAGGSPSGNVYLWQVTRGTLLKTWFAHRKPLNCMTFSEDDALLISGSEDGMICVWCMISLLDVENFNNSPLLYCLVDHVSSITGLLTTTSMFISSSLDCTCKAWGLISGSPIQTQEYSIGITAIVLDPTEEHLFSGSIDGTIFINVLHIGLEEDPSIFAEDQPVELKGHNGSITAMTFSALGLLSASTDCTVCLWNVASGVIMRRFDHRKGPVTNLLVLPISSLLPAPNHRRVFNQFRVSLLGKFPELDKLSRGMITTLHSCPSLEENHTLGDSGSTSSMNRQILRCRSQGQSPGALEMKVDINIENRIWALSMAKHVIEMNKHLQSRLLDMMQMRLFWGAKATRPLQKRARSSKLKNLH